MAKDDDSAVEDNYIQEEYIPGGDNSLKSKTTYDADDKDFFSDSNVKDKSEKKKIKDSDENIDEDYDLEEEKPIVKKRKAAKKASHSLKKEKHLAEGEKEIERQNEPLEVTDIDEEPQENKNYILIGIPIVIIIVLGLALFLVPKGDSGLVNQVDADLAPIAIVNGEILTKADIDLALKTVPALYRELMTDDILLNQTIMNTVLTQEADKLDLLATDTDVKNAINDLMQNSGLTDDQLYTYLKDQNLTMEEMEGFYRTHLSIENLLLNTAYEDIKVRNTDVREFYENNSDIFENISFTDAQDQINVFLERQAESAAFDKYMAKLLEKSDIEIIGQDSSESETRTDETDDTTGYESCAGQFDIESNTVLFVYSDSKCPQCDNMEQVVDDLVEEDYNFFYALLSDSDAKTVLRECYKDVLQNAIPQFICARSGNTIAGDMPEQELMDFADSC